MPSLDSERTFSRLDSTRVLDSIFYISDQMREVIEVVQGNKFSLPYTGITEVVVLGMGGSALAADVLRYLFADTLPFSLTVENGYHVPAFASARTLIVLSSYSGTTEEVLAAYREAKQRGLPHVVVTSGGNLARLAKKDQAPLLQFPTTKNPSGQPRVGLGHGIAALWLIFNGISEIPGFGDFLYGMQVGTARYGKEIPEARNLAKQFARTLKDRVPVLVASEHLRGVLHVFQNQLHETSKQFAVRFELPELNHHLMEGLTYPRAHGSKLHFLLISSRKYDKRISARYPLTEKVLRKQHLASSTFAPFGKTEAWEAGDLLAFGSYVSFYLAMLHGEDPAFIPWVKWFKAQMG